MRVYVAGPFGRKAEAKAARLELRKHEIAVVSSWMDSKHATDSDASDAERASIAKQIVHEVRNSDALLLLSSAGEAGVGRHGEVGIALGLGKPVVSVNAPESVLYHHPDVILVGTTMEAVAVLRGMAIRGAQV